MRHFKFSLFIVAVVTISVFSITTQSDGETKNLIGVGVKMYQRNSSDFLGSLTCKATSLEFSNYVGMPFKEALAFLNDALTGFGLRSQIKVLASGKILNSFNIFRAVALGADACYSARAMMMALGCIQVLECNKNMCPTGVATQIP